MFETLPGILFPCNNTMEVQKDDEETLFATDEDAANFLSRVLSIPIEKVEGRYYLGLTCQPAQAAFLVHTALKNLKLDAAELLLGTVKR